MAKTNDRLTDFDTVIIGSGIAGLSCAHRLAQAGRTSLVVDKGRGLGGRVATRRAEGFQFDHGAQYIHAKNADFAALIKEMTAAGAAADWAIDTARVRSVGTPGMSSIAKYLATGIEVRQGLQVTRLISTGGCWQIEANGCDPFSASRVVITAPSPQVPALLSAHHPLLARLARVAFAPCLTLMAVIEGNAVPFVTREDPEDDLAWIACDNSKPGRSAQGARSSHSWVAQASTRFSETFLEEDTIALTARMLPMLCDRIGASSTQVVYATAHRWRYARVIQPLGEAFVKSEDNRLYCGGDWCLGPRVEAAWQSGVAMAEDILLHTTALP
ncbi:MAG: hypothetical protein RLZZ344_65 [Pseudomonadota bacterium]|jgi:predicted NAD/FAD-dependent oxidoreductase